MPVMSTRGSISVRFVNHLVPRPPATINYQVPTQSSFYDIPGTYTWICPAGVTSVSIMGVGGGGGGANGSSTGAVNGAGGGGFTYVFSYTTTPGQSYTIGVGGGGGTATGTGFQGRDGGATYFSYAGANVIVAAGGDGARKVSGGEPASVNATGSTSVDGDYSQLSYGGTAILGNPFVIPGSGGGGGAGGYFDGIGGAGNGGSGGTGLTTTAAYSISYGAGGGGGGARNTSGYGSAGGGGVGLYGNGSAGAGGAGSTVAPFTAPVGGGGGSGGTPGFNGNTYLGGSGGDGGRYGGAGGSTVAPSGIAGKGASGALRVIWGSGRAFPSTSVVDTFANVVVTTSSASYTLVQNEQLYDAPGAYYWICPAGVTSVSVICIGGGGGGGYQGGGGGAQTYAINYPVTPGQGYLVVVGAGYPENLTTSYGSSIIARGTGSAGGPPAGRFSSYQPSSNSYVQWYFGGAGSAYTGGPGATGRIGGDASYFDSYLNVFAGGGENGWPAIEVSPSAMGGIAFLGSSFTGNGARGGTGLTGRYVGGSMSPYVSPSITWGGGGGAGALGFKAGTALTLDAVPGGGGAGSSSYYATGDGSHVEPGPYFAAGGGGIGVFSISTTGADGGETSSFPAGGYGGGGGGGSGGQPGTGGLQQVRGGAGGKYGGGGGGGAITFSYPGDEGSGGYGAPGAVRIIWGAGRSFGNTNTASTTTSVTIPMPPPRTYQVSQQAIFETPGRYTWIVPAGVTSISVMAVGGGGGGASWDGSNAGATGGSGAGYAYMYDYAVTPGTSYTIQVGAGGETPERYSGQYWDNEDDGTSYDKTGDAAGPGGIASWFSSRTVCRGGGGTTGRVASWNGSYYIRDLSWGGYWTLGAGLSGGGKAGGLSGDVVTGPSGPPEFGGGGAAGTSATKGGFDFTGMGYYANQSTSGGSTGGGGGGGGGFGRNPAPSQKRSAGGGGGIGIYGITATAPGSGAVGSDASSGVNSGGGGGGSGGTSGSGGEDITSQAGTATPSNGGKYGGGGGAGRTFGGRGSYGGHGVVRIIWGAGRAYPSTGTADSYSTVTF